MRPACKLSPTTSSLASSPSPRHYSTSSPLYKPQPTPSSLLPTQPPPPPRLSRRARTAPTLRLDLRATKTNLSIFLLWAVAAVTGGATVGEATAARVVLADGSLQRFPGGTRASQAVKVAAAGSGGAGAFFLCSADGLELGAAVAAVAPDEELLPGQLYFVLPGSMRRRPLQAEEMAALAIRASAALADDHDGPLVFPDSAAGCAGVAAARSVGKGSRRRSRRTHSVGRDFVSDLGAIAE